MKLNKSRAIVIILALVMLLTGIGAIFIGWRLSQDDSLLPEPGDAAGEACGPNLPACDETEYCDANNICQPKIATGDGGCCEGEGQGTCSPWEICDVANGSCQSGKSCRAADCSGDGSSCTENWQCCSGSCSGGTCQGGNDCKPNGDDCGGDSECCDGNCDNGTCAASSGGFACETTGVCNTEYEDVCWSHAGSGCWWVSGACQCGGNPGTGNCAVTGSGSGSSCTLTVTGNDCTVNVSVARCRESFDTQDEYNSGTNNGTQCMVGCSSSTQTFGPGTHDVNVGVPECGRWQLDVVAGGRTLCADSGCNDDGCDGPPPPPPPPGDKAECLETCTTDAECGTGLKCATVGSGKICIDADLSNGDQCFDLACEALTSSKTTANVGDSTTLNVAWDVPTSYTTDWSKLLYQSATGYSTIKQCNELKTCQENWTVTAFTNTPNNAFNFSSQLSFKAFGYNTSLVCQQDGKIIAQVSGNPQVGECDNDCTATLRPLGVSSVLPECTSLAFVKTVSSDTEYPIPGTFQGVGKNGDSSNLVTRYEIGLGATELTGTVNASALANINISQSYTVNAATTAVLTFLTASGTEYSASACRITIDGTTPTTPPPPEGEIPETGVVEDSIVVITFAVMLSYLTFFLYKNKIGGAMLITSLSSAVSRKEKIENSLHTSVNTRKKKIGSRLVKPRNRKSRFEKDAVDKFEN